jgi:PKD repeat protein
VDQQATKAIGNESWISSDGGITYSTDFYTKTSLSRIKGLNGGSWWGMGTGWNRDIIVGGLYHEGDLGYSEMYNNKTVRMGGGESPTGYVNPLYDLNTYCDDIGGKKLPTVLSDKISNIPNLSIYPNQSYAEMESSEVEWDPRCGSILFLGKDNKFYKSTNSGANFTALLTSSDAGAKIMQFEISRNNPDIMYVVQRDNSSGKIWKTINGGINWSVISAIPGTTNNEKKYMTITMSATSDNELWVGLKEGSSTNKVFKTTDGGTSWSNITTPTIGSLHILSIMHQMGTKGGVYVGGTDGKVYYRSNGLTDWQPYLTGLPLHYNASFLKPFYRDNKIRTGGDGGLWEASLYEPSSPVAQPMVDKLSGKNCPADTFYFDSYSVLSLSGATFSWNFPGASYVSSTNIRNPKVVYTPGTHSVTLTVSNANGTDTKTVTNLVTVTAGTNTPVKPTITQSGQVLTSSSTTGNQWCLNGNPIPGATNQNYTVSINGTYTVIVIKNGCASPVSNTMEISTVGMPEIVNPYQLSVYPNPNQGDFTITFNAVSRSTYTLEIINVIGQVIYKEEIKDLTGAYTKQLAISREVPGFYTLSLSTAQNRTVKKIIIY